MRSINQYIRRGVFLTVYLVLGLTVLHAEEVSDSVADTSSRKYHIVGKGETWGLVAVRYELAEEQLRLLNPYVDELHTGMRLLLPDKSQRPLSAQRLKDRAVSSRLLSDASDYLRDCDYGKAIKICTKVIDIHPMLDAYMIRGMAQAGRGKWRQASEDYERAMSMTDDEDTRESLSKLYADASKKHDQWWESRLSFWGDLGLTVAAVGAQVMNSYAAMESNSLYAYPSTPTYNAVSGPSVEFPSYLDPSNYFTGQPLFEYHQDAYGNLYTTANGLADAMDRMNADFTRGVYGMTSNLVLSGKYADASSLLGQLNTNTWTSNISSGWMRLPNYGTPGDYSPSGNYLSDYSSEEVGFGSSGDTRQSLQKEYDMYARLVEMWSKGIETSGYGYTDDEGKRQSVINGASTPVSAVLGNKAGFRNAQKKMIEIRQKAQSLGFTLVQSPWETAQATIR